MNSYLRMKKRIHEIMELARPGDIASRIFDIFIMVLIGINVLMVILETVPEIDAQLGQTFSIIETISVIIFSLEYIARLWSCTIEKRFRKSFLGRLKYMFTILALIDLFAILPFYLPFIFSIDLRVIRGLRLFRLFRLLKFGRYSKSLRLMGRVLKKSREELIVTGSAALILLLICSSLMYFFENQVQPEKFSSIFTAMWWGIATLTTVGYGDVYPVTAVGQILGAITAILGIGLFALPAGILGSGFISELREKKAKKIKCPQCGHIHVDDSSDD